MTGTNTRRGPERCSPALHAGVALSLLCMGCGEGSTPPPCVSKAAVPLFHATPEPAGLNVSDQERASIAAVHIGEGTLICTATLIAHGWAITAAHCALGDTTLVGSTMEQERTFVTVDMIAHDELDVALLAVEPSNEVGSTPIPLWDGPIDSGWTGARATLAGIGSTENGSTGELRFVEETIVDVAEHELWVDGMGRSGACHGDSGGPLLVADHDGRARVAGVLDRGSADCLHVDVYTRADVIREWAAPWLAGTSAPVCVGDDDR